MSNEDPGAGTISPTRVRNMRPGGGDITADRKAKADAGAIAGATKALAILEKTAEGSLFGRRSFHVLYRCRRKDLNQ